MLQINGVTMNERFEISIPNFVRIVKRLSFMVRKVDGWLNWSARILILSWAVGWIAFFISAGFSQSDVEPVQYVIYSLLPLVFFLLPAFLGWAFRIVGGFILAIGGLIILIIFAMTIYNYWISFEELAMSLLLWLPPMLSGMVFIFTGLTSLIRRKTMKKLVIIRHSESTWNKENRFTGWTDVGLTEKGTQEAHAGGKILKELGFTFDVAFTSVLKRAIKTLWIVLEEMDLMWLPVYRSWRLNERHYGGLQGLNKAETAEKHGDEQVKIWRRSYDIQPPALQKDDERFPGNDARYSSLTDAELPLTECLKDTVARFLPYWFDVLAPKINDGSKVLIVAHGNSLRALVKYLDNVSDADIVGLNIPTGVPLVYELDDKLKPLKPTNQTLTPFVSCYPLGDPDEIAKAQKAVENQGKSQKP